MTKQEKKFREMIKQAYMDYRDLGQVCASDYFSLEKVAQQVFGWTDRQCDLNRHLWAKEWQKENE